MTVATGCRESWCEDHTDVDGVVFHVSHEAETSMTGGGETDTMTALVATERDDLGGRRGAGRVRLDLVAGRGIPVGGLMTVDEALHLAGLLLLAARRAAS